MYEAGCVKAVLKLCCLFDLLVWRAARMPVSRWRAASELRAAFHFYIGELQTTGSNRRAASCKLLSINL